MTVDFHNHLMPGVDDGAQTSAESLAAVEEFVRNGVAVIVTTPHVDASITTKPAVFAARLAELDQAFSVLRSTAEGVGNVRIARGAELLLDIPEPDLSDARLRLAGTMFVLMEFPFMSLPPHSERVVASIVRSGYTPIIAHPERYRGNQVVAWAQQWKANGALLQVNGGSLLGLYGGEVREKALQLLEQGLVDYLCSDYHARGPARVAQYRALMERANAGEQAQTLMVSNPTRMLDGLAPLPVAPLRGRRTLWGRVAALFR